MSHIEYHAMCISSWKEDVLKKVRAFAKMLGLEVTDMYKGNCNGRYTFFVVPSDSKAGRSEAVSHLNKIDQVESFIASFEDDGNYIEYTVAYYGMHEG